MGRDRARARARAAVDEDAFNAAILFPTQSQISYAVAGNPRWPVVEDQIEQNIERCLEME